MKLRELIISLLFICFSTSATEYHVVTSGNDSNSGSRTEPLRTISAAANRAQPGDTITVHAGTYRERVNPPRGGLSDSKRIIYRASPGEWVEIKGSELVTNWQSISNQVWKVMLPNSFFGAFNPYTNVIHGDWFWHQKGREDHTGAVYLNGEWLMEATKLDDLFAPSTTATHQNIMSATPLWFAQMDDQNTTIFAQFPRLNPNQNAVEINVRQSVFFPERTNINYLTVRGFVLRDAATPWAPPTAKQVGLIGTHWSKDWIIESNIISHSVCAGVALGKYGDEWDNVAATAEAYVNTVKRALTNGWSRENIGHHVVRGNTISHCEQAGIVGSLGATFSTIEDNCIHDIHVRELFGGAEMAGIKIHGAIDVQIRRNHISRTVRGIWLDWMAQGTRVSGNLLHENQRQDVFLEVDHGPFLFDNNIFLSPTSVGIQSQGGAFVHNLFAGAIVLSPADKRMTPFHKPHSTEVAGYHDNPHGDVRFYNNIFVGRANLTSYDSAPLPVAMDGNVFVQGALAAKREKDAFVDTNFYAGVRLIKGGVDVSTTRKHLIEMIEGVGAGKVTLEMNVDPAWRTKTRELITTKLLGKTVISDERFETPDGNAIRIGVDCIGRQRSKNNPAPGPFEIRPGVTNVNLTVWLGS